MPCLVRWPQGKVPAASVNDQFLSSMELFPSFAAASGTAIPDGLKLDGYDWWPVIRGHQKSPRQEMFWKRKDLLAARVGKWKWVDMGGKAAGLFDLNQDVGEQKDLSKQHPQILRMVKSRYENWLTEMEAAEPRGPFRDY